MNDIGNLVGKKEGSRHEPHSFEKFLCRGGMLTDGHCGRDDLCSQGFNGRFSGAGGDDGCSNLACVMISKMAAVATRSRYLPRKKYTSSQKKPCNSYPGLVRFCPQKQEVT